MTLTTYLNETKSIFLSKAILDFRLTVPELAYELQEASGTVGFSAEQFSQKRLDLLNEIAATRREAHEELKTTAQELGNDIRGIVTDAAKELEDIKRQANKISVDAAQRQFDEAARTMKKNVAGWACLSVGLFAALIFLLLRFSWYPPPLIRQVVDLVKPHSPEVAMPTSVPLLLAASAYFTSLRLALIGVLGIGLAFSLRMTRAYFQMIEHNNHKLRVTKSIEAFVASARTAEQKDLVLGKLIDAVTTFGESGIIDRESEKSGSGLPSIVFDAVTKNIGKP